MDLLVLAILGGVLGVGVVGSVGGAVGGAAIGALAGWGRRLAAGLNELEKRLARVEIGVAVPADSKLGEPRGRATPPVVRRDREVPADRSAERPDATAPRRTTAAQAPDVDAAQEPDTGPPPAAAAARVPPSRRGLPLEPSLLEVGFGHLKRWFTTGNVPVKVGVVLSVFGVGFLIKEGIDRHWLVLPIELRLLLVASFGVVLLAIGWRLRRKQPVFARSVQGGGIAVLYLTTYASFALYEVLPGPLAFAVLSMVTASAGALAVLQDGRALAVLGIVGGFLAPVLTSTDSGNHVALFGYYTLLNLAILGVAWFKAWRELNLLGFLFTFGIGALWGYDAYRPELFATTEPFLVLFVLLYATIPVLFATRGAGGSRGFVDATLTFGTPLVGFGLQSRLVAGTDYGLAISALALAALYVGFATFLHRRRVAELRVLIESQLALGAAFVTVAVPLALDARWTSASWALQGAAMVWLGFRQRRRLALAAGVALQVLSGSAYAEQPPIAADWLVLNGYCLGAVLLALAGAFSSRLFEPARAELATERRPWSAFAAALLLIWASGWWLWAGFSEIHRWLAPPHERPAELLFVAATTLLAMVVSGRLVWPRLNVLGLVAWPFAVVGVLVDVWIGAEHPAANFGWLAWSALCATLFVFLRRAEQQFTPLLGGLHAIAYWVVVALLALETHWLVDRVADGVWPVAATFAVTAAVVLATLRACTSVAWPFVAHARVYLGLCCGGALAVLLVRVLVLNLESPGDASPLKYVPLLNPLELASVFAFGVFVRWIGALQPQLPGIRLESRHRVTVAAAFGALLITMAVARTVHHYAAVPFDFVSLTASTVLQAALSIVWGATGLAAMTFGARNRQRALWLAGAALMTVVVAKLFLVDLGNTGTLGRVVSFLGVGVLLLIVGYFAPVPPRAELERRSA